MHAVVVCVCVYCVLGAVCGGAMLMCEYVLCVGVGVVQGVCMPCV